MPKSLHVLLVELLVSSGPGEGLGAERWLGVKPRADLLSVIAFPAPHHLRGQMYRCKSIVNPNPTYSNTSVLHDKHLQCVQVTASAICLGRAFRTWIISFFLSFLIWLSLGQVAYTPMGMSPMIWLLKSLNDSLIYF